VLQVLLVIACTGAGLGIRDVRQYRYSKNNQ